MGLHLAAALLFTVNTQHVVHAPGRCVPAILTELDPNLLPEQRELLAACQGGSRSREVRGLGSRSREVAGSIATLSQLSLLK